MQKKFIQNLALVLFLNLLIKPYYVLGIEANVQNALGNEVYGSYYALWNFTFLFNILLDVGITNFNNKNIAQNNHLLQKHLSSILVLRVILAFVFLIITLVAGWLIDYSALQLSILVVLTFNQILLAFIGYLRSNLAGLHLFKTDSFLSILDRLILIGICGVLLWGNITDRQFELSWFIYAQTSAYLLTAIITLVIVLDKARIKRLSWDLPFFLMILKKSYPFAILVLLMTFYNRVDTVILERFLADGAKQCGIYASGYRLLDAANMIAFLFAGLLLPMFAKMVKHHESVEELVKLAFSLLVIPAIIVGIGSYFYQYPLMNLIYKDHIEESAKVFGLLMFCFIAISTTYIFGTLLTANGNLRELNFMGISGIVVNITLNFILIPHYKAAGSAVSSLITQFITALLQVFLVQYLFKFKINYRFLASLGCFIFGAILINIASQYIHYSPDNWQPNFVIMVILCFALAFALRILSVKSIYHILKNT